MRVTQKPDGGLGRRQLLQASTSMAALALMGGTLSGSVAFAAAMSKEQRDKLSPDDVLALMKRGNERFRKGKSAAAGNVLARQRALAKGQYPAAIILSCIDARAPAEVIMDLNLGDVFNARVAGNISNTDILGSMEFACKAAGAKVALVMGHTACGAIKGAIDNVELGNLTALLAKLKPAVQATTFEGERSSKNPAFVDAVARKNVELTMASIRENSQVLRELEQQHAIKIAGAMYSLETGMLDIFS